VSPAKTLERINYISGVYNELTSRATPTPFRQEQQAVVEPKRAVRASELVRNTCSKASELDELKRWVYILGVQQPSRLRKGRGGQSDDEFANPV